MNNAAAAMHAGGADTTVSSVTGLVLAMTLSPAVLKKAREEIDEVIGVDRLLHADALVKKIYDGRLLDPIGVDDGPIVVSSFALSPTTRILAFPLVSRQIS
ncbi:cytochrome P450 [Ilyonectria robusta]